MIKKCLPLFFCLMVFHLSFSQQLKKSLTVFANPMLSNRFITFKDNVTQQFKDSINKADINRKSLSAGCYLNFDINKYSKFSVGIHFLNIGFTRKKSNLKFLDTIHPEIGIVADISQIGDKYVLFNYRYQHISLPFLYHTQFRIKKFKSSKIYYSVGGSLSYLLNHDIKAKLYGFSAYGKKEFILENAKEEPSRINLNVQTGIRFENMIYPNKTWIFVQPTVYFPLLTANYGQERHHLYAYGLEIGLHYLLDAKEFKEEQK